MKSLLPGDGLALLLAAAVIIASYRLLWQGASADKAIVRAGGKVFAELTLSRNQRLVVPGPLGNSVVEVKNRKVRVAQDPSPRQYCVQQGWLERQGEVAICLPNQISLELTGKKRLYDSLNY